MIQLDDRLASGVVRTIAAGLLQHQLGCLYDSLPRAVVEFKSDGFDIVSFRQFQQQGGVGTGKPIDRLVRVAHSKKADCTIERKPRHIDVALKIVLLRSG
jgi:hypothetical protein